MKPKKIRPRLLEYIGSQEITLDQYVKQSIEINMPKTSITEDTAYEYEYNGVGQLDKEAAYNSTQKVPLYDKDILANVIVADTYSGIQKVSWTIVEGKKKRQRLLLWKMMVCLVAIRMVVI